MDFMVSILRLINPRATGLHIEDDGNEIGRRSVSIRSAPGLVLIEQGQAPLLTRIEVDRAVGEIGKFDIGQASNRIGRR